MQAEYRFQLSEEHVLTALLRYRQQVWWRRPFIGRKWLLAVPIGVLIVLSAVKGLVIAAGVFGSIGGALLLGWPIDRWIIRKRFRKSPFHNDLTHVSVSEAGVHVVGRDRDSRTGWPSFTKGRRFKDGLLLFHGPQVFHWLPDSAVSDVAGILASQELARIRIEDYRDV